MISSTTISQIDFVWITGILMNVVTILVEYFICEITKLTLDKLFKFIQQNASYLLTTILFPRVYTMGNNIIPCEIK